MDNSIISALIGVGGSLIGGICSYKGSQTVFKAQIQNENKRRKEEEEEKVKLSKDIIDLFLHDEIKKNYYDKLKFEKNDDVFIKKFIQDGIGPDYGWKFEFDYSEYDKIKYELIKYHHQSIKNTIEIYKMFKLLEINKKFSDLTDEEFEFIKKELSNLEEQFNKESENKN